MLTDGGTVELDMLMVQVILNNRGAAIICQGCHHRKLWEITLSYSIEVSATTAG